MKAHMSWNPERDGYLRFLPTTLWAVWVGHLRAGLSYYDAVVKTQERMEQPLSPEYMRDWQDFYRQEEKKRVAAAAASAAPGASAPGASAPGASAPGATSPPPPHGEGTTTGEIRHGEAIDPNISGDLTLPWPQR